MPKMKTHKGASKRFKMTGSGKIKKSSSFRNHILETKSPKRKRQLRHPELVAESDVKRVRKMMPYA